MIGDEFKDIVANGEFSTSANGMSLIMIYEGVQTPISAIVEQSWKRKEVDGVLTTDLPRQTLSFLISEDSLPENSLFMFDNGYMVFNDMEMGEIRNDLQNITFIYDSKLWETVYTMGRYTISFLCVEKDDLSTPATSPSDDTSDAPNLVI